MKGEAGEECGEGGKGSERAEKMQLMGVRLGQEVEKRVQQKGDRESPEVPVDWDGGKGKEGVGRGRVGSRRGMGCAQGVGAGRL